MTMEIASDLTNNLDAHQTLTMKHGKTNVSAGMDSRWKESIVFQSNQIQNPINPINHINPIQKLAHGITIGIVNGKNVLNAQ